MSVAAPLLRLTEVRKSYPAANGGAEVLRGVDMVLEAGETLALSGESGSGKSTLLHLAGALDTPDSGRIETGGTDLARLDDAGRARIRRSRFGMVFQQFNLIPSLSVRDNIAFQARLAGRYDAFWCATLADRLRLDAELDKYPEQLSGGQQQRVAVGRALSPRPPLVLADEPTGNLDEATGDRVLDLMLELVEETRAGLLLVTHSARLAARLQRRLHLSGGRLT